MNPPEGKAERHPTRRHFVRWLLGLVSLGYVGALLYPVYRYLITGSLATAQTVTEVEVGPAADIANNTGRLFQFGNIPGLLIRDAGGAFHAYNATCTHLGCTVEFRPADQIIYCPCHGGKYAPDTGRVVAGPPPRPLEELTVAVREGIVFVTAGGPRG